MSLSKTGPSDLISSKSEEKAPLVLTAEIDVEKTVEAAVSGTINAIVKAIKGAFK